MISFPARALRANESLPLPIYKAEEMPGTGSVVLTETGPENTKGMLDDEAKEKHLQKAICSGSKIPTLEDCEEVSDYEDRNPEVGEMPKRLVREWDTMPEEDSEEEEGYDLDSDDEDWVKLQPECFGLTENMFEKIIYCLEQGTRKTVMTCDEAKAVLKDKMDEDVITGVYDYWLNKRLKTKRPLMPQVSIARTGDPPNNPYLAFRPLPQQMKTRKQQDSDKRQYQKMVQLRQQLGSALDLLGMVKQREMTKRELISLNEEIFYKKFEEAIGPEENVPEAEAVKGADGGGMGIGSNVVEGDVNGEIDSNAVGGVDDDEIASNAVEGDVTGENAPMAPNAVVGDVNGKNAPMAPNAVVGDVNGENASNAVGGDDNGEITSNAVGGNDDDEIASNAVKEDVNGENAPNAVVGDHNGEIASNAVGGEGDDEIVSNAVGGDDNGAIASKAVGGDDDDESVSNAVGGDDNGEIASNAVQVVDDGKNVPNAIQGGDAGKPEIEVITLDSDSDDVGIVQGIANTGPVEEIPDYSALHKEICDKILQTIASVTSVANVSTPVDTALQMEIVTKILEGIASARPVIRVLTPSDTSVDGEVVSKPVQGPSSAKPATKVSKLPDTSVDGKVVSKPVQGPSSAKPVTKVSTLSDSLVDGEIVSKPVQGPSNAKPVTKVSTLSDTSADGEIVSKTVQGPASAKPVTKVSTLSDSSVDEKIVSKPVQGPASAKPVTKVSTLSDTSVDKKIVSKTVQGNASAIPGTKVSSRSGSSVDKKIASKTVQGNASAIPGTKVSTLSDSDSSDDEISVVAVAPPKPKGRHPVYFKRKRGCKYLAPIQTPTWRLSTPSQPGIDDRRLTYYPTSLEKNNARFSAGLTKRRVGRGGRIILDRAVVRKTPGQGTSGQGTSKQGSSGQGTSGQGSSGQGTSGQGSSNFAHPHAPQIGLVHYRPASVEMNWTGAELQLSEESSEESDAASQHSDSTDYGELDEPVPRPKAKTCYPAAAYVAAVVPGTNPPKAVWEYDPKFFQNNMPKPK